MICWKCQKALPDPKEKIGYRAACSLCGADLHTCTGCRYYCIGKPNDCLIPGTDPIRDREKNNFCEEFKPILPKGETPPPNSNAKKILGEPEKKKSFKDLFPDS
jgi:hypothetical protein